MGKTPLLGILTLYVNDRNSIEERPVFEKMTVAGRKLGMFVYVFTPDDVKERERRIYAMVFHPKKNVWGRRWVRFPNVIYDRARYQRTKRFERLLAFRRKYDRLIYLNRPLRNKWVIYRTLSAVSAFRPHLPSTRLYESPDDVVHMLRRFSSVYFKPINGTGGRGILRIDRLRGGTLLIQGRDHTRAIVHPQRIHRDQLPVVIRGWDLGGDKYIVQQGVNIRLPGGRVHDYRMLVQKDGGGQWQVTGCAGRVGPRNSITSNLHGGGTAASMHALLREWVENEDQIARIRSDAESFAIDAAKHLESTYGTLCELALDLAIDRRGRVWLLEVNPKPAREVFLQAGERAVYRRAVALPMEYALWVYHQQRNDEEKSDDASSGN